jgi:hypothetical protein
MDIQVNDLTGQATQFSAVQLARWGLLDAVRREAIRDRLIANIPSPSAALNAVLIRQWMEGQGLNSPQMLEDWLCRRQLNSDQLCELVSREWRWQRWCEGYGNDHLITYFLSRKAGLDRVRYWHLTCAHKDFTAEIYQRLREGEVSFDSLTRSGSVGATQSHHEHFHVQLVGPIEIEHVSSDLRPLLKSIELGVLCPPQPTKNGSWHIVRLEERLSASLDESMRLRLFEEIGEAVLRQEQESS